MLFFTKRISTTRADPGLRNSRKCKNGVVPPKILNKRRVLCEIVQDTSHCTAYTCVMEERSEVTTVVVKCHMDLLYICYHSELIILVPIAATPINLPPIYAKYMELPGPDLISNIKVQILQNKRVALFSLLQMPHSFQSLSMRFQQRVTTVATCDSFVTQSLVLDGCILIDHSEAGW